MRVAILTLLLSVLLFGAENRISIDGGLYFTNHTSIVVPSVEYSRIKDNKLWGLGIQLMDYSEEGEFDSTVNYLASINLFWGKLWQLESISNCNLEMTFALGYWERSYWESEALYTDDGTLYALARKDQSIETYFGGPQLKAYFGAKPFSLTVGIQTLFGSKEEKKYYASSSEVPDSPILTRVDGESTTSIAILTRILGGISFWF